MLSFLGQKRPNSTTPDVVLKFGKDDATIIVNSVFVTEVSGLDTTFSIFVTNIDNTNYDENTAIFFQSPLSANDVVNILGEKLIILNYPHTKLVVQVGNANGVNFTFFGERILPDPTH